MANEITTEAPPGNAVVAQLSLLDRFLPVWIGLAMLIGIVLGKVFAGLDDTLAGRRRERDDDGAEALAGGRHGAARGSAQAADALIEQLARGQVDEGAQPGPGLHVRVPDTPTVSRPTVSTTMSRSNWSGRRWRNWRWATRMTTMSALARACSSATSGTPSIGDRCR